MEMCRALQYEARHPTRCLVPLAAVLATIASAILVKERSARVLPLAVVEFRAPLLGHEASAPADDPPTIPPPATAAGSNQAASSLLAHAVAPSPLPPHLRRDPSIRWFDGRPVRPVRQMWMTVTAYSPDARSCGPFADGRTATMHSVHTNAMRLVAADTRLLPFGSLVSVPGYDEGRIVPVLDRGSAIRGRRLDVLFPTHEQALRWGRRRLLVTIWEYADGLPPPDPRHAR